MNYSFRPYVDLQRKKMYLNCAKYKLSDYIIMGKCLVFYYKPCFTTEKVTVQWSVTFSHSYCLISSVTRTEFTVCSWHKPLNALTWPEVFRGQMAIAIISGPNHHTYYMARQGVKLMTNECIIPQNFNLLPFLCFSFVCVINLITDRNYALIHSFVFTRSDCHLTI